MAAEKVVGGEAEVRKAVFKGVLGNNCLNLDPLKAVLECYWAERKDELEGTLTLFKLREIEDDKVGWIGGGVEGLGGSRGFK